MIITSHPPSARAGGAVLVAAVLALAGCSGAEQTTPPGAPLPASELAKYQACTRDTDCVYAQNGCCDCVNGGADVAINATHVADLRGRFKCEGVPCTRMAAVPECGSGQVSCASGKCRYTPPTAR